MTQINGTAQNDRERVLIRFGRKRDRRRVSRGIDWRINRGCDSEMNSRGL